MTDVELELHKAHSVIVELRGRINDLEHERLGMVDRLFELLRHQAASPAPVTYQAPIVAQAAAQEAPGGPKLGPKAQRAISAVAGRNRAMAQELYANAMAVLEAEDVTDAELAMRIMEGESPDLDPDDDGPREIPGGNGA